MKDLILKKIQLTNFKGIRNLCVEFDEQMTTISGANGIGKTTIFDAFTWVLFGKDSDDRKQFNIKTLDHLGRAIPRLPHEVIATLQSGEEEITLCRKYNEKWQKKRGAVEEEFTGHEEELFFNDVPCSVKEWKEKIAELCDEQIFKFITNPMYFTSQKPDVQRAMLFRMAGEITDDDIAAGNEDFKDLLRRLSGKTLEELRREILAKKRKLKERIAIIPELIAECERLSPEPVDEVAANAAIAQLQTQLDKVEEELIDKSKQNEGIIKDRERVIIERGKVKEQRINLEYKIQESVTADYRENHTKRVDIAHKITRLERQISDDRAQIIAYEKTIAECHARRNVLIEEWRNINSQQLHFNDKDFVCPTCNRRYEIHEIEGKQNAMIEAFNLKKSELLKDNNELGKANKQRRDNAQLAIIELQHNIALATSDVESLQASMPAEMAEPNARVVIEGNAEWQKLMAKEKELTGKMHEEVPCCDTLSAKAAKQNIIAQIDTEKAKLAQNNVIKTNKARISELEQELRTLNQTLAEIEGVEYTASEFAKAKIEMVERRINGMFSQVTFKMFKEQINGGEVETCEAMVNGVPFADLNNAGKINAGLDIIAAICNAERISAPVFIDNAEAVNNLRKIRSQMVRLVVTNDAELVITRN